MVDVSLIKLRPAGAEDEAFLFALYAATRERDLNAGCLSAAQKEAFVRMQFEAQCIAWREQFPRADFLIIESAGEPVGRLYVDWREDEILIIDIALIRGRQTGIGRRLLKEILRKGADTGRPVRGSVEWNNPAIRLFQRIGFRIVGLDGPHYRVEAVHDAQTA